MHHDGKKYYPIDLDYSVPVRLEFISAIGDEPELSYCDAKVNVLGSRFRVKCFGYTNKKTAYSVFQFKGVRITLSGPFPNSDGKVVMFYPEERSAYQNPYYSAGSYLGVGKLSRLVDQSDNEETFFIVE